jgi:hypothetical protein
MLRNLPRWFRVFMCFAGFALVILYFAFIAPLTPPLWIRLIFSLLALVYTLAITIACMWFGYRILMYFGCILVCGIKRWIKDEFL